MSEDKSLNDKRQRDFDDLQHEVAGRDVGRISRFLGEGHPNSPEAKRKKAEQERTRHRLAMLLQDPIYRARYDDTWEALRRAELASDRALDHLAEQIAQAQLTLDQMEDDAARLPDGTMAFRDAAGVVRRADGSVVDDTLAATILWEGNEPSYEDYLAAQDRLAGLQNDRHDVERYQTDVLGTARDRMTDEANPPSLDELDRIMRSFEAEAPAIVVASIASAEEAAPSTPAMSQIALPTLGD